MRTIFLAVLGAMAVTTVAAAEEPLICFGAEPNWSVRLDSPGTAQLALPDDEPVQYRGSTSRHDPLRERIWRGRPVAGDGGDLVVFLREAACSDGMSDTAHPFFARVSLADGRFLAGCCRVVAQPTPLERTNWRLVDLPGVDPAALQSLTRALSLRFETGRVSGFAGCNNLMGSYALAGGQLTLGQLAGTMMACPGEAMMLERSFHTALAGTHRVAVTGDRLTLTAASGKVMSFQAEVPPTITGGTWKVTGYNNGRQAVVSPALGTDLSLAFAEDGSLSGNAGCNSFRASYTVDGDNIKVGPAATTRKFCGEELMDQERAFLAALGSVTRWTIDGGMLDAHRADGERALTATRKAE